MSLLKEPFAAKSLRTSVLEDYKYMVIPPPIKKKRRKKKVIARLSAYKQYCGFVYIRQ